MRIPFPERIPLWHASIFAGLLAAFQMVTGTDPVFSLLCILFVFTAVIAFNVCGGLTRPSGAYVFFFAILACIFGLVMKIVFWEPGNSNLHAPTQTMRAYLAGMVAMLGVAYLNRRVRRDKGILQEAVSQESMRTATIGCVVAGIGIPFLGAFITSAGENIFTPIATASYQLNRFLAMAIILGVTYEVRQSNGRRSVNVWVLIAAGYLFFNGVFIGFGKESIFMPPLCWLAAAAALGYRFRRYQLLGGLALLWVVSTYLVPYCQVGRNYRTITNTFMQNVNQSLDLLARLPELRETYLKDEESIDRGEVKLYFNQSHGIIDRLQMLSMDDMLMEVADDKGSLGLTPIYAYIANTVPHVIWKDKPTVNMANVFGHEVGLLAPDDDTTSISFSPVGEAYRLERWGGVFLIAPTVWFLIFLVTDSLCGDLRRSPWGILALATFAHVAPEGGIGANVYSLTFGTFIIAFVAFFSAYIMPLLASLVAPQKRRFNPAAGLQPIRARKLSPSLSSEAEAPGTGL